jgi:hypothetical protein
MYTYPSVSRYTNRYKTETHISIRGLWFPNRQWDIHFTQTNPTMTTSHTTSPLLRVTADTDTTTTPHKTIRGFFRETEDDIIDDSPTTNSNSTHNETTPTQPIPKNIGKMEKTKPTFTGRYRRERQLTQKYSSRNTTHLICLPSQSILTNQ